MSARAHALQCAQLAEWDDAPPALVAAALLHDIGHFIPPAAGTDAVDDVHELRALGFLAGHFDAPVTEPIRLHVQAKRWLVVADPHYAATLSAGSRHSLTLQGGPMGPDEMRLFQALPWSTAAITLRRWDDRAKQAGRRTPPLDYYLEIVATVMKQPVAAERLAIGALDVA